MRLKGDVFFDFLIISHDIFLLCCLPESTLYLTHDTLQKVNDDYPQRLNVRVNVKRRRYLVVSRWKATDWIRDASH